MSHTSISKRIMREWKNIEKEKDILKNEGIRFYQVGDKINDIQIFINGAKDTPFEGGEYELRMLLTGQYPMEPPKVFFHTNIFHPNISESGKICLDILKDKWTPAINIVKVVFSIIALMSEPNIDDPLNNKAADLWKNDKEKAYEKVREYVKKYATPVKHKDSI